MGTPSTTSGCSGGFTEKDLAFDMYLLEKAERERLASIQAGAEAPTPEPMTVDEADAPAPRRVAA